MEEIQLKDICDLDNGYAFKSDDYVEKSGTLNCRMSNIRPDGTFDILYSAKYLPDEFADKYEEYILHDGDLIIAMTDMAGDPKILGVPTVVNTQGYTLLLNQRVGRLRFIKNGVNADYLKLALQCPRVRNYLKRFAGGGVQLNVSKKDILSAPVRMCNEKEQTYVADIFKSVLEIKAKREHKLQLLDDLIKARFVEMFGDVKHEEKYKGIPLRELCLTMSGGTPSTKNTEYYEGNIPWITTVSLGPNHIDGSTAKGYITQDAIKNSATKLIPAGNILFGTRVGVGKSSINDVDICTNQDIIAIIGIDENKFNRVFIKHVLDDYQPYYDNLKKGATILGITSDDLKDTLIPDAPIDVQTEFVAFVEQVDKSKVAIQKSLDETQLLFDSLMQKYFG